MNRFQRFQSKILFWQNGSEMNLLGSSSRSMRRVSVGATSALIARAHPTCWKSMQTVASIIHPLIMAARISVCPLIPLDMQGSLNNSWLQRLLGTRGDTDHQCNDDEMSQLS